MRRERDTPTPHTQGTNVRQVIPHLMTLFNTHKQKTALHLDNSKIKQNLENLKNLHCFQNHGS